MDIVPWSYELPPEGDGSEGVEGYAVESSAGERVGTAFVVLRRGTEQYLAVRRVSDFRRELPLVPWAGVAFVDHRAHVVRLALSAEELAAAPRLSRRKGTHGEGAEAVRVLGLVSPGSVEDGARRGWTAARYVSALGLAALGCLTSLAAFALTSDPHWREGYGLFAVPAALFLGALASGAGLLSSKRLRRRRDRGRSGLPAGTTSGA